jgi:hypothetical protein
MPKKGHEVPVRGGPAVEVELLQAFERGLPLRPCSVWQLPRPRVRVMGEVCGQRFLVRPAGVRGLVPQRRNASLIRGPRRALA